MRVKTFLFSKIQRSTEQIEGKLNEFLSENILRTATCCEGGESGKLSVSIVFEPGQSDIRVKYFRDQDPRRVTDSINRFLDEGNEFKFMLDAHMTSRMTKILFYTPGSGISGEQQQTGQDPQ